MGFSPIADPPGKMIPSSLSNARAVDGLGSISFPRAAIQSSPIMDPSINSTLIIGSKLALAMSLPIGSPIRRVGTAPNRRRVEFAKMDRRCEALKNRILRLPEEVGDEDTRIACEAASLRSPAARGAALCSGKVMGKILEHRS